MHGELTSGWCLACDQRFGWEGPMGEGAACPACQVEGRVRPAERRKPALGRNSGARQDDDVADVHVATLKRESR
jgi:hypothetical protein